MSVVCVLVDHAAPHSEECSFWHGGSCDCHPDLLYARTREHCRECDFVNSYTGTHFCNCDSVCLYPNDEEHECELRTRLRNAA